LQGFIELNTKKLQNLAIVVDKILREEIDIAGLEYSFVEARVYNIKTVGVQGDQRTYGHPAEITLKEPKHTNGSNYSEKELYEFLEQLSTRVTNEVKDVSRVVYVTGTNISV